MIFLLLTINSVLANHKIFYEAILKDDESAVKEILPTVNVRTCVFEGGDTATHIAVFGTNTAILDVLVSNGAPLTKRNNLKYAPLDMAVRYGNEIMTRHLIEKYELNVMDSDPEDRNTLLHLLPFAPFPNNDILLYLLAKGARVHERNAFRATPLIRASMMNNVHVLRILLDHHSEVDAADKAGNTALHYAVKHALGDNVEVLLEFHAKSDLQNKKGLTAWDLVEKKGNVRILIAFEKFQRTPIGWSVLGCAIM